MSTVRTQIIVEHCTDCPFFERTAVHALVDIFARRVAGQASRSGTCKHGAGAQPFPIGRIHVPDETRVPDACPLRHGDCLVQLQTARP